MPIDSDSADPDLLGRIPLAAASVLEVGCGAGALAAAYKRRNPKARYVGIESDPVVAEIAAARMDAVAVADVEQNPLPFGSESYDCIIYGGVLNRLRDPWSLLRQQAQALHETGTVVISVANLEHWSFTEQLLRGSWNYEEGGVLDRANLRWFNLPMMRAALADAGLHPIDVWPGGRDRPAAEQFARAIEPGLAALGIDAANYLRRASIDRYIWRACRRPAERLHLASTMLAPVGGVSHVRVVEPMQAMGTDPFLTPRIVNPRAAIEQPDPPPRIFVYHRPALAGEKGLEPIRELIAAGYLLVCEFDDHPDYIKVLQRPNIHNFRAVHAIQTSTEPLAAVLRRENPEIAVFPNGVYELETPRNFADPSRLTLFFAGLNRDEDWPPLIGALNAVAAVAGDRLNFHIVNDRGLFEALTTPHKHFTPLCDYATYLNLLAGCEFSFMPLADGPFNRCKSDLKFLEASSCGVTAIASTVVYANSIEDGHTGVLFRDARELQQKLLHLIAQPDSARAMALAARAYVAEHRMLAYQVSRRIAWYRSLWSRREALHRALLARVPELARPA
jgi:SAM-dependent methyltransferase